MATMRDSELCALIDREARDAIGVDDYFAADRERAMEFYLGEAKGELAPPAIQGRSKVVSKDLMDTVEWAMPALMRMFASQDDICRFEPETPEDEQSCEDATQYVGYLINRKNNGFITTHDAIKQALIARMGVTKTYCDKSSVEKEERYQGVSAMELQALQDDPEVEVVEVVPYGMVPPAGQVQGMPPELAQTFDVTCKRKEQIEKFVRIGVPPEEIRIAKDTRTIDETRFIAHVVPRTRSDLISEGWPKDEVMNLPAYATSEFSTEKQVRHDYDGTWDDGQDEGDTSQEKVEVIEAYTRVDYNKDGVAELRRVVKSGTYVHENEVVDDHPFSVYSPILMPYKVIGLSFYDLVEDLMRIRTALTRQMLDNAYLANNPRTVVEDGRVNLDDLLNPRVGGLVRVKGDVNSGMREMVTPFIGPQAQMLLEHFGQVRDTRTGVTEMNSALNAESLAKGSVGSEGVQALMQAGAQRLELIARVIAETGIRRDYLLMLKLVTQYQNRVQQVKINGRWLQIDPREWKNQYDVTVSVGLGNASKQQQVANLSLILNAQKEAAAVGLATPQNIYNALSRLTESMGYKDSDQFWTAPQPGQQPNQGPPPEVIVEQMKQQGAQQLAQIKAQADIQVERMKQEFQAQQAQQETQLEAERNAMELQNQMALEQYKTDKQMELELAKAQIQRQTAIDTAQISAQASVASASMKPEPNGQD